MTVTICHCKLPNGHCRVSPALPTIKKSPAKRGARRGRGEGSLGVGRASNGVSRAVTIRPQSRRDHERDRRTTETLLPPVLFRTHRQVNLSRISAPPSRSAPTQKEPRQRPSGGVQ